MIDMLGACQCHSRSAVLGSLLWCEESFSTQCNLVADQQFILVITILNLNSMFETWWLLDFPISFLTCWKDFFVYVWCVCTHVCVCIYRSIHCKRPLPVKRPLSYYPLTLFSYLLLTQHLYFFEAWEARIRYKLLLFYLGRQPKCLTHLHVGRVMIFNDATWIFDWIRPKYCNSF